MNSLKKNPLPPRWLNCPRKSDGLILNTFMVMKTPLSSNFDDQVPPECRFTPDMVFKFCKLKKIKLGLWIDLTNTNRFYNSKVVEENGCRYVKLQCRGHGETPSKEQTKVFIDVVNKFVSTCPLEVIAVHCTHGFNRSGFLIVSYLVDKLDMELTKALETFAQLRPVGIYKQDYIDELYRRYDEIRDSPAAPPLPEWCSENDHTNNLDDFDDLEDNGSTSSQIDHIPNVRIHKKTKNKKEPKFMEGVRNVHPFTEEPKASELQRKVHIMCGWRSKGFPGSQPVSMDIENIELLSLKPYRVSWKADGTRYMMLIDGKDEVYFFDRDHNVFKVDGLTFVYRKNLHRHLTNTLIDGEMVIDKVNGEDIPRYLAYDIIKFEDQDVGKMPFHPVRMSCIENEIIRPRNMAIEQELINKALEPFSIRKKDFWDIRQAASLLGEKFAKALSHEPDGLIFQPSKDPYQAGRCDDVLKWKPLDMNSIDFRLKIVKEGGMGKITKSVGYLYVGQSHGPFAKMNSTKAVKHLDNKIVECKYERGEWKFMRERTDKSFPNSLNTAEAVWKSITQPVTKEMLLGFIKTKGYCDDSEMMPPPKKVCR